MIHGTATFDTEATWKRHALNVPTESVRIYIRSYTCQLNPVHVYVRP